MNSEILVTDLEYLKVSSSPRIKRILNYIEHLQKSRFQELKDELRFLDPLMETAFSIHAILESWPTFSQQAEAHEYYKAVEITGNNTPNKWVLMESEDFQELTKGDCHE